VIRSIYILYIFIPLPTDISLATCSICVYIYISVLIHKYNAFILGLCEHFCASHF